MPTRGQVKLWVRNWLGTGTDDPVYGDTAAGISPLLDPAVQQVVDQLIAELHVTNPQYLSKFAVLAPQSATSRLYPLASQTVPITDFAKWLELRITDEVGSEFEEAKIDELTAAGSGFFCVTGPDDAAVLQTSPDTQAGIALWLRYAYWPADLADDAAVIPGIPPRFHDVVALETLFVFAVGGESRWPEELRERRRDRHAALIAHVGKRGIQPNRTRLDRHASSYLG